MFDAFFLPGADAAFVLITKSPFSKYRTIKHKTTYERVAVVRSRCYFFMVRMVISPALQATYLRVRGCVGTVGGVPNMLNRYSYQSALAAAESIHWRVEDIIGGEKRLNFTQ